MPQHEFSRIEGIICLAGGDGPKTLPTRESLAICALAEHGAYTVKLLILSAERISPKAENLLLTSKNTLLTRKLDLDYGITPFIDGGIHSPGSDI